MKKTEQKPNASARRRVSDAPTELKPPTPIKPEHDQQQHPGNGIPKGCAPLDGVRGRPPATLKPPASPAPKTPPTARLQLTRRQLAFLRAGADEVLFGGAAGGGKSYAQILDALVYALQYPGSRQLILRRTMPELERTLVRAALAVYPRSVYRYSKSDRIGAFANGSTVEFGYCDRDADVYRYQSAEYDVIRFDELTHFTEAMYLYLLSRLRGVNGYPKQVKSTSNPGNVGHAWVKRRFIDAGPPDTLLALEGGTRQFLPARVTDNVFLMLRDPGYLRRLANLGEEERRRLLDGDWDLRAGQYFGEWRRALHVCAPFPVPAHWTRVFAMDYGLDMLAGYWFALDPDSGRAFAYREAYAPELIISQAARHIRERTGAGERVSLWLAPPDLWNRRQDSGRSAADIFAENGIPLTRASAARVPGWYALKELLAPRADGRPGLVFFDVCAHAIRCLPALLRDAIDPNDCAVRPHEITHAPDAIRYFAAHRAMPGVGAGRLDPFDGELEALRSFGWRW